MFFSVNESMHAFAPGYYEQTHEAPVMFFTPGEHE
jgi:hypothetical protein